VRSWLKKGCLVCTWIASLCLLVALFIGGRFLVQHISEHPEEMQLTHEAPPAGSPPGRIVLSLSSAAVTVKAGPAGGPIRVESNFDPDVHELEQNFEEADDGGWSYRLDFHEKKILHISVVSIWLGKRSPEVMVEIPRGLPLALETKMEGGYLALDLAGLELSSASVELDRGVLGMIVSEPLATPMERLSVKGRIGTMVLRSLGNASPKELDIQHGLGAALVDLDGLWLRDAAVDFQVAFGEGELRLPEGVRIEGLESTFSQPAGEEIPKPTLSISTHFDVGDIRVVE
jgi:hypothetical protein